MLSTTILSDEQLVRSFLAGNTDAMTTLVNRYKSKVFTAISLLVKDRYAAEDIFQDLFVKVINTLKKDKYAEEGKFVAWLMRVAHNLCMDHFRKMKNRPVIKTSDNEDIFSSLSFAAAPSADHQITRNQTHESIRKMIDQLPEEQREVVILRHYANMNFKDIAATTNCSVNTSLGRMRYALINLRKMMNENQMVL